MRRFLFALSLSLCFGSYAKVVDVNSFGTTDFKVDFKRFSNNNEGIQAVILDWAGTTQDYGCMAPMHVFRKVFEKEGVPISEVEARKPMGAHKKIHIRRITQIPEVAERWEEKFGVPPTETDVERMFADFVPMQLATLDDFSDLIPGTLPVIDYIRHNGWKIGSTTGYTVEMQKVIGDAAKRQGYEPDATVTADMVPEGRPAPYMVLRNCELLRADPAQTVKVDDTIPGVWEGINAGAWGVHLYKTGNEVGLQEADLDALEPEVRAEMLAYAKERGEAVAHYTVSHIRELPAVLHQIDKLIKAGHRPSDFGPHNPAPAINAELRVNLLESLSAYSKAWTENLHGYYKFDVNQLSGNYFDRIEACSDVELKNSQSFMGTYHALSKLPEMGYSEEAMLERLAEIGLDFASFVAPSKACLKGLTDLLFDGIVE